MLGFGKLAVGNTGLVFGVGLLGICFIIGHEAVRAVVEEQGSGVIGRHRLVVLILLGVKSSCFVRFPFGKGSACDRLGGGEGVGAVTIPLGAEKAVMDADAVLTLAKLDGALVGGVCGTGAIYASFELTKPFLARAGGGVSFADGAVVSKLFAEHTALVLQLVPSPLGGLMERFARQDSVGVLEFSILRFLGLRVMGEESSMGVMVCGTFGRGSEGRGSGKAGIHLCHPLRAAHFGFDRANQTVHVPRSGIHRLLLRQGLSDAWRKLAHDHAEVHWEVDVVAIALEVSFEPDKLGVE